MRVFERITELREAISQFRAGVGPNRSATVGFVPTMGCLHAGHESLMRKSRGSDDLVVLSIFVNPLQFGPDEDYDRYPRNLTNDLQLAERAGADYVFMPSVQEMYPKYPLAAKVTVGSVASVLCGASRPGHFDGVATVVTKLFNIVQPDRAYFGLKDVQQIAVIQEMVRDLNMPVEIVPCPTVREQDGLAISSRNVYLNADERRQSAVLSNILNDAGQWLEDTGIHAEQLENKMSDAIKQMPLAILDYATVLSFPSLLPLGCGRPIGDSLAETGDRQLLIALAVKFGRTRLIDNRIINLAEVAVHV